MYRFVVILAFTLSLSSMSEADTCCHTGYSEYDWCSSYCCEGVLYNYCCSDYSESVSYNDAWDSDCQTWWPDHMWLAVVIGLGSLATVITAIVLVCCCIKGVLCKSRTTGRVVTHNPQHNPNVFMMSNTVTNNGQTASGQYAVHMQPVVYTQGYDVDYTHQAGNIQPPPYSK